MSNLINKNIWLGSTNSDLAGNFGEFTTKANKVTAAEAAKENQNDL